MKTPKNSSLYKKIKLAFIGKARDLNDRNVFGHVTLIAFFAWIGLGSDGLSSSCYGPEEAFRTLGKYHDMAIFVAIAIVVTIFIISTSYSQIIKLFPSGGGGYKVATKLLSPRVGMVSGCSLLIDYTLTISLSVAAGIDAMFSFIPTPYHFLKFPFMFAGIGLLIILNIRGIKESVFSLMPIFILFVITHIILILYAGLSSAGNVPVVVHNSISTFNEASKSMGVFAVIAILLKSYSMGAGTYTGLEAVSNSLPILKAPRVKTGLITMRYMAVSLSITVLGLMLAYSLFHVQANEHKTLNAVLLEIVTKRWGGFGIPFVVITLFSEATLLFIAAQTGFLDGPRVMANMANDRWFPKKLAVLSDRLVTQNGVMTMGLSAIFILAITGGKVKVMIVLYSINVFITFALSQAGMVRHWWLERKKEKTWLRSIIINGIGFILTTFILVSVVSVKFKEGGWVTILITSSLVFFVTRIRKHYIYSDKLVLRLDNKMIKYVENIYVTHEHKATEISPYRPEFGTAVVCVNEYNGLGIETFIKITEEFQEYKNFIFLDIGIVDAGNFKGAEEMDGLKKHVQDNLNKYKKLANHYGFFADTYYSIGTDVADEVKDISKVIKSKYPYAIFFTGQFIFPRPSAFTRMLHNQTQYAIQNRLAHKGFIMVMIPVRYYKHDV